jgi:3-isopropylmalate dehydratase small subunit
MAVGETHPCAPGPRGVAALDKRTGAAISKTFAKVYSKNCCDLQLAAFPVCSKKQKKKEKQLIPKGRAGRD